MLKRASWCNLELRPARRKRDAQIVLMRKGVNQDKVVENKNKFRRHGIISSITRWHNLYKYLSHIKAVVRTNEDDIKWHREQWDAQITSRTNAGGNARRIEMRAFRSNVGCELYRHHRILKLSQCKKCVLRTGIISLGEKCDSFSVGHIHTYREESERASREEEKKSLCFRGIIYHFLSRFAGQCVGFIDAAWRVEYAQYSQFWVPIYLRRG